ncbi:MAG: DUF4974 domain-containing protein [Bacteroidaceae bacterium]|nr:DUF4974 domain-containing protein [Bacteroidaceae bacterium]
MKEELLTQLARSTRSPKGRYDAAHSWKKLQRRMHPEYTLNYWYTRAAGIAAFFVLAVSVWAFCTYVVPQFTTVPEPVIEQETTDQEEAAPKALVFQDMPLAQIVQRLEQTYHTPIQIEGDALKSFHITATFQPNEKLDDILEILKDTSHCKLKKNGKTIVFYQ